MGIPPESKQKSSIIEIFIKLILTGILLSPVLFILQQFFVFVTYTPERYRKKNFEIIQNFTLVNRTQGHSILENGVFAKTFNELAIGTLQGENVDSSKIFQYKLDISSKDLAIIGAKSLDGEKNGFNGAVLRYKNRKGFFSVRSIICESAVVGADGTNPKNSPVVNTSGNLICAAGWKVLREDNEEPSDRDLIKLIQIKTIDEIGMILHEQKLIYLDRGVFPDKYNGTSKKESRFSPKFNVKVRHNRDSAIVVVQPESSEREKYETYFGFIKITKFDKIRPLTEDDIGKYIQVSFLCTSDRSATPLPNNKTLDRIRDRCPNGYTKSPIKT